MEKPERRLEVPHHVELGNYAFGAGWNEGYNEGLDIMEAYYKWKLGQRPNKEYLKTHLMEWSKKNKIWYTNTSIISIVQFIHKLYEDRLEDK